MTQQSARPAAILLALMSVPIIVYGMVNVAQLWGQPDYYPDSLASTGLAFTVTTAIAVYGLAHALAAAGAARGHGWGRWLGAGLAAFGGAVGLMVLPTAFDTVYRGGFGGALVATGPNPVSVFLGLSVVPYVVILGLLVLDWTGHRSRPTTGAAG